MGVRSKYKLELFANQGKDYDAEGEDTRQPGHGCSCRDECSQAEKQEEQNSTPASNCLGHVHFSILLNLRLAELPIK